MTPARGEALVAGGIEHHTQLRYAALFQRDRDAEDGIPVRVVRGPIERIDHPSQSRASRCARSLLGENRRFGQEVVESLYEEPFRSTVRLGHQIYRALQLHLDPAQLVQQERARFPCGQRDAMKKLFVFHGHMILRCCWNVEKRSLMTESHVQGRVPA